MNKLVHFLGYTAAIVVVGILVMTATGQLSPALRGSVITSSAPYPNVATPTAGGTVTPDGQFTVTKGADGTYTVTENAVTNRSPAAMMGAGTTGGSSGGDTGGGAAMMAAAAVTCQPGIQTRGPYDPGPVSIRINCPSSLPAVSYFQAAAVSALQSYLGCTNAAANAAQVACPDSANCQKNGVPVLQTPNPFTTCAVTNRRRNSTTKTCTADVDCTAAQCDYKQNCVPKPRKTCCYSDNKTVATCRDGAGTCAAGEEVGTDYPAEQCAMNCKPVNTRCCKPASGPWSCSPTCPAGVTGEVKTISECSGACFSSTSSSTPTQKCCAMITGTGVMRSCKASCGSGETEVGLNGQQCTTMTCVPTSGSAGSTGSTPTPPPTTTPPSTSSSAGLKCCQAIGNDPASAILQACAYTCTAPYDIEMALPAGQVCNGTTCPQLLISDDAQRCGGFPPAGKLGRPCGGTAGSCPATNCTCETFPGLSVGVCL